MTTVELEIRVKNLESEVTLLKSRVEQTAWWEKIAGTFADDETHEEAMRLGREYRTAQKTAETENDNS